MRNTFKPENYPVRRLVDMSQELLWVEQCKRLELAIPFGMQDYITIIEVPAGMQAVYSVYEIGKGVRDLRAYPHPKYRWVSGTQVEFEQPITGMLQILRRTDVGHTLPVGLNLTYEHALHITQEIIGAVRELGRPPVVRPPVISIPHGATDSGGSPTDPQEPPESTEPSTPPEDRPVLYLTKEAFTLWAGTVLQEQPGRWIPITDANIVPTLHKMRGEWDTFVQAVRDVYPEYEVFAPYPAISDTITTISRSNAHPPNISDYSAVELTHPTHGYVSHHIVNCCPFEVQDFVSDRPTEDWVAHGEFESKLGKAVLGVEYMLVRNTKGVWLFPVPTDTGYPSSVRAIQSYYVVQEQSKYRAIYWEHNHDDYRKGFWKMTQYTRAMNVRAAVTLSYEKYSTSISSVYTQGVYFLVYWFASGEARVALRSWDMQIGCTPVGLMESNVVPNVGLSNNPKRLIELQNVYRVSVDEDESSRVALQDCSEITDTGVVFTGSTVEDTWRTAYIEGLDLTENRAASGNSQDFPRVLAEVRAPRAATYSITEGEVYGDLTLDDVVRGDFVWRQHELLPYNQDDLDAWTYNMDMSFQDSHPQRSIKVKVGYDGVTVS